MTTETTKPKETPITESGSTQSKSAEFSKTTGTAAESKHVPDNEATDLKAKHMPADSSKGQNDVRDPEDPKTNPKNVPTDVDDTGDGINKAQNLDAPGPKPLEEIARTHGGDAGVSESTGADKKDDDDAEDGLHGKSKGEGTGELYVKSSGLVADGGDFDATKPGAGKEADRKSILLQNNDKHVTDRLRRFVGSKGHPPREARRQARRGLDDQER